MCSSRKRLLILAGVASLLVVFVCGSYAQRRGRQAVRNTFSYYQHAVVELGVSDKDVALGEVRAYDALFIVTGEDGKQYKAQKRATSEESAPYEASVVFPDNFDNYPSHSDVLSHYRWKCVVEGKVVAGDQFQWGGERAVTPQ